MTINELESKKYQRALRFSWLVSLILLIVIVFGLKVPLFSLGPWLGLIFFFPGIVFLRIHVYEAIKKIIEHITEVSS